MSWKMVVGFGVWLPAMAALGAPTSVRPPSEYREIDAPWAEKPPPDIQWLSDADETFRTNTLRWKKELETAVRDSRLRDRQLHVRQARLLRAMVKRFKPAGEKRIAAYEQIAEHLGKAQLQGRANVYRARLIDEFPGRLDVAARALRGMLDGTHAPQARRWRRYAADRLIALNEAGFLPDAHPWVTRAVETRSALRVEREDLPAAGRDLQRLRRHLGGDALAVRQQEADLLFAAGRLRAVRPHLQNLREAAESRDRRETYAKWLDICEQATDPVLPRRIELDLKWDALMTGGMGDPAGVADIMLGGLSRHACLLERPDGLWSSLWRAVRDHIESNRETLGAIRKTHAGIRPTLPPDPIGEADLDAVMEAFRRHPYSPAVHHAMLAVATAVARAGKGGLARRCFRDVLDATGDTALAARARAGLLVAAAQAPDATATLDEVLGTLGADAPCHWLGRTLSAGKLRRALAATQAPCPASPTAALASLRQVSLRLPMRSAWAPGQLDALPRAALESLWFLHGRVVEANRALLVVGPNLLARFDDNGQTRYLRTAHLANDWIGGFHHDESETLTLPAATRPVVHNGTVFCRWGLDRDSGRPNGLAAFDLNTGRMRWSAATGPAWDGLEPISGPAVADGRAYVLAARAEVQVNTPIVLVCLDATTGRKCWQRPLAHQTLSLGTNRYHAPFRGRRVDLARYGGTVTAVGGEVYVSTSAGFVARCDGRDGRTEWLRTYDRPSEYHAISPLIPREGGPPVVRGRLVVFLPRDGRGAFALDRQTGRVAWDNPYLPSDHVFDAPDAALGFCDGRHVASVDAATGRVRWMETFAGGLVAPARTANGSIYVATADGLVRLDASTGVRLERADWKAGAFGDFAVRAGAVVGIGPASAHAGAAAAGASPAPASAGTFRLPLARVESLGRTNPQIVSVEPAAAGRGTRRAWLLADGALECIDLAPGYPLRWRTLLAPGAREVVRYEGLLVALYSTAVAAYDENTGRPRWHRTLDEPVGQHWLLGPYLVLARRLSKADAVLLDVRDGRVLWVRRFDAGMGSRDQPVIGHVGYDGRTLQVFVKPEHYYHRREPRIVLCRPGDGGIVKTVSFPTPVHRRRASPCFAGGTAWYFGSDSKVHELALDGSSPPVTYPHTLPDSDSWGQWKIARIEVVGPWICARSRREHRDGTRTFVLRRGQPDYLFQLRRHGTVRGNTVYDVSSDTVTVVDLPSRKESVRCSLGEVYDHQARVISFRQTPEAVLLLAFSRRTRDHKASLRIDRFDRKTGQCLASQDLPLPYWSDVGRDNYYNRFPPVNSTVLWHGDRLVVASPYGLMAYAPAPPAAPRRPWRVAQVRGEAVVLDGSPDEWDAGSSWPMTDVGASAADGRVLASHDKETLYLAVSCRDADARPRIGTGQYGGGDFLELAIDTQTRHRRVLIGQGPDGRGRIEPFLTDKGIPGARAAVGHDAGSGRTTYEIALPMDSIVYRSGSRRRMGLSATVWDDRARRGPVPVARFGHAIRTPLMDPNRHERMTLGTMLRRHENACLDIAMRSPDLPEARDFVHHYARTHSPDANTPARVFDTMLRAHARSPDAVRVMALLDQTLRRGLDGDPAPKVISAAKAAGVSQAACQRYLAMTKAYLSQWVRVERPSRRQMIMIQLNDGRKGTPGWNHRVFWGDQMYGDSPLHTPGRQRADIHLPAGGPWVHLRVPLIWLDMHDKPIHGVSFICRAQAQFDRTAVARAGAERVVIDDEFPPGEAKGKFRWQSGGAKSGSRSLAKRGSISSNYRQDVLFAKPVTDHLLAPPSANPLDRARAVAALKKNIPLLAGSPYGWTFFQALLRLDAGEDESRQAGLYEWYLRAGPDPARTMTVLERIQAYHYRENPKDWIARMNALILRCRVPEETAYTYRLRHHSDGKTFVRAWQVLGPFRNADTRAGTGRGIERTGVDLAKSYAAGKQTLRWRLLESKDSTVSLDELFPDADDAFAYAVCWVHSDRAQPARVEFGVDDGGTVWLNRTRVLSCTGQSAYARQKHADVTLPAGWSQILLRLSDVQRRWGFCFELVNLAGDGLPKGIRLSTTPPK